VNGNIKNKYENFMNKKLDRIPPPSSIKEDLEEESDIKEPKIKQKETFLQKIIIFLYSLINSLIKIIYNIFGIDINISLKKDLKLLVQIPKNININSIYNNRIKYNDLIFLIKNIKFNFKKNKDLYYNQIFPKFVYIAGLSYISIPKDYINIKNTNELKENNIYFDDILIAPKLTPRTIILYIIKDNKIYIFISFRGTQYK
jgi:hypothetical protein